MSFLKNSKCFLVLFLFEYLSIFITKYLKGDVIVESRGIVRRVDELGRIVLPREMRKITGVRVGSKLEIGIVEGNKFLLTKYSDIASLKEYSDAVIDAITVSVEHDVLIVDMETVLSASKKKYIGKTLKEDIQELIFDKQIVIKKHDDGSEMLDFFSDFSGEFCCQLMVPILKDGDAIGAIIVLACENKCFDDSCVKVCRSFAKYLSEQIS